MRRLEKADKSSFKRRWEEDLTLERERGRERKREKEREIERDTEMLGLGYPPRMLEFPAFLFYKRNQTRARV